jgi:repressor LexA
MEQPTSSSQQRLLDFLEERETNGLAAPTYREICDVMGYRSTNAATDLILALEKLGLIARDPKCARSIRLVRRVVGGVPFLGSIPAGFPQSFECQDCEPLNIDPCSFGITNRRHAFALRVRGDSMIGRHLFDGDVVLFDRSAIPRDKDIVAALIDHECTLKTLVLKKGNAWLKAENPDYPDLIPVTDLSIQGVAKAVIRLLAA